MSPQAPPPVGVPDESGESGGGTLLVRGVGGVHCPAGVVVTAGS
ncbi:hypothetical protein OG206_28680 [Streptomyces sp. NBC_01341]|nr:hypothetical protein OG206_28680 [Streptomyces sp. NBC_01341]